MRFDLVVNLMTLTAFEKGRLIVMGGGLQWRPLVHVSDVSKAFLKVMESPIEKISSEIFNIGLDNFQIKSLAYLVREEIKQQVEIEIAPDDEDQRDYNVLFNKAATNLEFEAKISINHGIREIYKSLINGRVDTSEKTVTVKWYRSILEAKKLIDSIKLNNRII
jgi:nucleoside-diphosphate-sugar epimerase